MTEPRLALDTPPTHWEIATYEAQGGESIRYGWTPIPKGETRNGIILLLEGRREFIEKLYETIRDFEKAGYACMTFDWPSQGLSSHYPFAGDPEAKPHHIPSFDRLVEIVGEFHNRVIPACFEGHNELPRILFGHSMGGHLGLRYLADHPKDFACAGFTAPMISIRLPTPPFLDGLLVSAYPRGDNDYHPGGGNWDTKIYRKAVPLLTNDARRGMFHPDFIDANPDLQIGSWTMGTLREAYRSTQILKHQKIETPTIIFPADRDILVRSRASVAFAKAQPAMECVRIKGSYHDLYMESDPIRNRILDGFLKFVGNHTP
ncbi:MAG: alpha/beta fold hydrolase [Pseudobdellovibrionaceae bacterium]